MILTIILTVIILALTAAVLLQRQEIRRLQITLKETYDLKEAAAKTLDALVSDNLKASATIDKLRKAYNGSEAARKKLYAEVHGNNEDS